MMQETRGLERGEYRRLRDIYKPDKLRVVIVAESPPAGGKYFYKPEPEGRPSEPLYSALVKHLDTNPAPQTKGEGLRVLQRKGWFLVDATYEPVNRDSHGKSMRDRERQAIIDRDFPLLKDDLNSLGCSGGRIPLVLIKAIICKLEQKLLQEKFRVLNEGRIVPFPSGGGNNVTRFHCEFGAIVKENLEVFGVHRR
jgi:hypothetical protein